MFSTDRKIFWYIVYLLTPWSLQMINPAKMMGTLTMGKMSKISNNDRIYTKLQGTQTFMTKFIWTL